MATATAELRANTALQLLAGNDPTAFHHGVFDDGMDNEDDLQWEWVYADSQTAPSDSVPGANDTPSKRPRRAVVEGSKHDIVAARLGKLTIRVGDTVTLKADRNDVWVAIVNEFLDKTDDSSDEDDIENEADDSEHVSGKKAMFTWLSSPREIRNPRHRRTDCLPNELYATANSDVNPLEAIMGHGIILSAEDFNAKYPGGKFPRGHPDAGRTFVCRRGANLRTVTYTSEFKWGTDVMQGVDPAIEVEELIERVERETVKTRKRKNGADTKDGLKDFVVEDDANGQLTTPRKKQKFTDPETTPRKRGRPAGSDLTPKRTPSQKFTTPTHKRIVEKKPIYFTPLGSRILSQDEATYLSSPHAQARTQLHVASVPASLPCREEEFSTVYTHLDSAISDGTGACLYISGTPGTGKTATVREVVAQLNASVAAAELDDFLFVEINGMRLTDPHQSYAMLWEALTGARVAPTHALSLLNQEFSRPSPRRVPIVVLMDELDQLATRSQSVMYNFFQWPTLRHSRLIVLAVANTMDLPERTLSNKISSRLGLTRILFQGYSHPQLMKIVETRLAAVPSATVIVDPDAVQFAARKVAGVSGDARRCLDICRRAVELAEAEIQADADATPPSPSKSRGAQTPGPKTGRVTITTVQRAIREATSSPLAQYLRSTPVAAKLFLAALLARVRRSGVAESCVGDVCDEAKRMGALSERPAITALVCEGGAGPAVRVPGLGHAAMELLDAGVITMEERRGERAARCRLLVGEEDVKSALREDEEVRGLGFDY